MKAIKEAMVYWDATDPANEGWAWRVTSPQNEQESGEWNEPCDGSITQLEEAVVSLAWQHGLEITVGHVAVDGQCATFVADIPTTATATDLPSPGPAGRPNQH